MPNVMGVIDGTCIFIAKLVSVYSKGYFFHKLWLTIKKMFMEICVNACECEQLSYVEEV
jgi:hypothetical protein